MIRAALLGALSLAASLASVAPAQQGQRIELSDLAKAVHLSTPQFAPDGASIAVVVSRPNFAENREVTSLVLVHVRNGTQTVLLRDRPGLALPTWSPSGDRIAFIARADTAKESKAQLFVLTPAAHTVRRLAAPKRGVQHFAWRPDGAAIAEREPTELFHLGGVRTAAESIEAWNPVFDVTPHELIDVIVTERGVIERPDEAAMRAAFAG